MEAFVKEFALNPKGLRIVKCCSSCAHCADEAEKKRDKIRLCMKGNGEHDRSYFCGRDWTMKKKLMDIEIKPEGNIKKPKYIAWLKERVDELNQQDLSEKDKRMVIEKLPAAYEKQFGSRYMNALDENIFATIMYENRKKN